MKKYKTYLYQIAEDYLVKENYNHVDSNKK